MKKRYLQDLIQADMAQKMVFLAGPRQAGKTTLAKEILGHSAGGKYFSWDRREDRRSLLKAEWPSGPAVVVLDELHKYKRWKTWLKGEYDAHREKLRILVTGSARMDVYRKGGDSLQGRYHHYRLHPFSMGEAAGQIPSVAVFKELRFPEKWDRKILLDLLKFGGFPEPFLSATERVHRRWQKERLDRFFREDVRDLEDVRELSQMQLLSDLLPDRAGSLLSLNNLREDLEVSHRAVSHWLDIFERLYFAYRLRPFTAKKIRGLKKEPKLYLWDWTLAPDRGGARFENLTASHLLKFCHYLEDAEGYNVRLSFLRDVSKREADFLVTLDGTPWFAVEAKSSEEPPSRHLSYFGERLRIPFLYQIHLEGMRDYVKDGIRVMPAGKFLSALI